MKKEKKIIFILSFLINFSFLNIFAQDLVFYAVCNFMSWIKNLLLTIGILSLIFGGYKILTAGGDPGRMEDAKKIIIIALVGMAVISGIINFIKNMSLPTKCNF